MHNRFFLIVLSFILVSISETSLAQNSSQNVNQVIVQPRSPVQLKGSKGINGSSAEIAQAKISGNDSHLLVVQDPELDEVLSRRLEYNKRLALSPQGYRILIYSGNLRQEAYNAQMRFRQANPNMDAYLSYQFPNFKVMAGDFHSRDDAAKSIDELKALFPNESLLVIPQKIDISKIKQ